MNKKIIFILIILLISFNTIPVHSSDNENSVHISISDIENIYGFALIIKYDGENISFDNDSVILNSDILAKDHFIARNKINHDTNTITLAITLLGQDTSFDANIDIGHIPFEDIKEQNIKLDVDKSVILDIDGNPLKYSLSNIKFHFNKSHNTVNKNKRKHNNKIQSVDKEGIKDPLLYNDVENYWAKPYILDLSSLGIVHGFNDGDFHPDEYVTRSQVAKMLAIILDDNIIGKGESVFIDRASIPSWAYNHIIYINRLGIMKGFVDNSFRPKSAVSKGEMAVIIDRVLEFKDIPVDNSGDIFYNDEKNFPHWCRDSISNVSCMDIMGGCADGCFRYGNHITRGECCEILVNLLDVL